MVFDPVGFAPGTRATAAVARLGRVALIGYASGSWPALDPLDMVLRSYAAVGVFAGGTDEEDRTAYGRLAELAGHGLIRTPVRTVVSFDDGPGVIGAIPAASPGKAVVRLS